MQSHVLETTLEFQKFYQRLGSYRNWHKVQGGGQEKAKSQWRKTIREYQRNNTFYSTVCLFAAFRKSNGAKKEKKEDVLIGG